MIAVDNFHAILRGISIDHVIRLGIGNGIDHDQVTRPETYIRTNKFIILNLNLESFNYVGTLLTNQSIPLSVVKRVA